MQNPITPADLDMSKAKPCISAAQKFVLPVPAFQDGGEPLSYPVGHEKAGTPITDWEGKPIGGSGLVFYNDKDKVVQAAKGDGQSIVIINQVNAEQAQALVQKVESFGGNPSKLSLEQVKEVLQAARDMGLGDQYNSDQAFMKAKFTPVAAQQGYGLFKRDDRDLCQAVMMDKVGHFAGPAGEPQAFYPGDVIVAQPDGKGGHAFHNFDGEVFRQTYTAPSGLPVDMATIPENGLASISAKRSKAQGPEATTKTVNPKSL